ncbi:MAG: efflux RND transporter periplasmic adaptor subunit, partial [Thermoguttaceae bacterium]|nr:efflux RND transporter periplasmic adaptor subunit [Thermoguttaceae bacterium]
KDDLNHCKIVAPIQGKIGTNRFTEGNYVTPTSGTLVTLVQTSPIRVRFSISNRDYLTMFGGHSPSICENGIVELTLANDAKYKEKGLIEYVENLSDENSDTVQVFINFPNVEQILKPGETVAVTLRNKAGVAKTIVPASAIMQDIKGAYVWTVDAQNVVHRQYIIRGKLDAGMQMVDSGLEPGMRVVSDGTHKVAEGDTISPKAEER